MITIRPLGFDTEVTPQVDLPAVLADRLRPLLAPGDVVVVTSKIVSKWLGLYAPADADRADLVLQHSRSVVAERATTGGITRLVDRMIAAGLIERVPCPTDRRVYFAALTAAGQAKLSEAATVHAANLRQAFNGFTKSDLQTFDKLLDRLRSAHLG